MEMKSRVAALKCASGAVVASGVLVGLGALPATAWPAEFLLDLVFWPVDGGEGLAVPGARLLAGIGGGILIGWGVMLWQITTRLMPRDPALARRLILTNVSIWFVADCAGSVAAGAPLNVLLNLVFLAAFVAPLLRLGSREVAPAA